MEVLNPAPKTVQAYLGSRLLVFMFREFLDFKKSGYLPRVRAEDVSANFPALNDAFIKKKLKPLAELQVIQLIKINLCELRQNFI